MLVHPLQTTYGFVKEAVTIERGDPVSGGVAKVLAWINPAAYIVPEVFDPVINEKHKKREELEKLMKNFESAELDPIDRVVLEDLKIRTAGPNPIDDLIYESDPTGEKKWYQRTGGRTWQGPTSVLTKLFHTVVYPLKYVSSMVGGPHYDPGTRAINMTGKDPGIWTHELGHALEYGREYSRMRDASQLKKIIDQQTPLFYKQQYIFPYVSKGEISDIPVAGVGGALIRSISSINTAGLPFREWMANELSLQMIGKAYKDGTLDKKEVLDLVRKRQAKLPAGMATYLTLPIARHHGMPVSLGSLLIGRLYGMLMNANTKDEDILNLMETAGKNYDNNMKLFRHMFSSEQLEKIDKEFESKNVKEKEDSRQATKQEAPKEETNKE